ncbi:hypothetical protein [Nocardia sp. NPDC049526]|uniref:hypothetical protein n=1 Tax=Nocardia sp. NPDC049526 TaxID=3364316 RepID=UPI0037ADED75
MGSGNHGPATMSLDGFIADPTDQVGPLFDWYGNGDIEVAPGDLERMFQVTAARAKYLTESWKTPESSQATK